MRETVKKGRLYFGGMHSIIKEKLGLEALDRYHEQ